MIETFGKGTNKIPLFIIGDKMFGEATIVKTHGFNCYFKDIIMTDVDSYEVKQYSLNIEQINKAYGECINFED